MSLQPPNQVVKLQTALHAKAKAAPTYRFYVLYDKLYRWDVLAFAYERCKANQGAAGVDGQTFQDIEAYGERRWLEELAKELQEKTYRASPVKRVWIPKPDGKQRPLGIPTIRDRVVQMATVLVLEPIFEADLQPEPYAYRPGKSALDAVKEVQELLNAGYTDVVDADLSGYFDSIPHAELMKSVARRVSDRHVLHLVKMWLVAPVEETDERGRKQRTTRNKGRTPRHAARRSAVAALGESVHASVHRGMEAIGPRGAAGRSPGQLRRRLRDLYAWQRRRGDVHDACDDGATEADGERKEDAAGDATGRCVHVLGVHVLSSILASDGAALLGPAPGREEDPRAVPRHQRADGSAKVSTGSLGRGCLSQPQIGRLGELLLSGSCGPGLWHRDETRSP
jgi:Reverse transcriptase (RNA-dependent DNA polymerase)